MSTRKVFLSFLLTATPVLATDPEAVKSWSVLVRQSDTLHRQGNLPEAADAAKRAVALAKSFDRADLRLATSYYMLGAVYRSWGHCGDSRSNYVHALSLFEKYPGAKPRYIFNAMVGVISEASECDDHAAAQKLYRTYGPALQRYGSGPADESKILSLQGGIARGRKHFAEAEDYFRRAIQVLEQAPGSNAADIAELRSSLAVMLSLQKRHVESLAESERSIALLENFNPRYITLPAALNNAACTLVELGRRDEAERTYQRALTLARDLYGEENRNTAKIMMNYAVLLRDNRETPAADALEKKGVDAYRRSLLQDSQTIDVEQLKR
jgi:tetratricopeptide (TPR) repeat protein